MDRACESAGPSVCSVRQHVRCIAVWLGSYVLAFRTSMYYMLFYFLPGIKSVDTTLLVYTSSIGCIGFVRPAVETRQFLIKLAIERKGGLIIKPRKRNST